MDGLCWWGMKVVVEGGKLGYEARMGHVIDTV